ncbi:ribosomal RNA small subunit methyltransferase NEP1-like isoform X3 [Durio zibethinus]|uniref:Ribosomal RNA small subunit methyltransferase NEP1-like isoform X3 n=1 Tax=Durio zibethinus TaxID=66656 RepID=A0A6P5YRU0_DURZI|nr:ribosomal RNA small subunit methyltransferase NEP1-like isoform X3 [Durio zibethinus]
MVRPYALKGKKRKKREEKYDREEEEEEVEEKESAKRASIEKPTKEAEAGADELVGIPISPGDQITNKHGVIFVLEKASLEVAKVGKSYQLLNSDDHANFLRKNHKNPADYRPDIVHQLLQKLYITAVGKRQKLLQVIKNPVTKHFPVNSRKIGFSYSSEKLVKMRKYVDTVGDDVNLVFGVGAMAHGKIETEYTDDCIAISGYPLSAAMCIARITEALADKWNIL